jgi:hypothetical protein
LFWPDRLQRELNLQNRQVEKAVIACDDCLNEAARRVEEGVKALRQPGAANGHALELN